MSHPPTPNAIFSFRYGCVTNTASRKTFEKDFDFLLDFPIQVLSSG